MINQYHDLLMELESQNLLGLKRHKIFVKVYISFWSQTHLSFYKMDYALIKYTLIM